MFSLREEAQREVISVYQRVVEDVATALVKCIEKIYSNADKTRFLGVLNASNEIIEFYNQEVARIVLSKFDMWEASDGSLCGFVITYEGGEEAIMTARRLQNGLRVELESLFSKKFDLINVSTAEPKMDEEAYERLGESATKLCTRLEEIEAFALKRINRKSEDNEIFMCIEGVVRTTVEAILGGFESFSASTRKLTEDFQDKRRKVKNAANATAQSMSTSSNEAEELFRSFGSGFRMQR